MQPKQKPAICLTAFLVAFLAAAIFTPLAASQDSAISTAQDTIKNCYDVVKQAEAAGANVDALMVTLNDAAGLLSKAQLAYAAKDYGSTSSYAAQSQSALSDFIDQANAQKKAAQQQISQNFVFMVVSSVASVAILCGGIAGWVLLGRKDRRNIHGSSTI